jgi:hypothetical protein
LACGVARNRASLALDDRFRQAVLSQRLRRLSVVLSQALLRAAIEAGTLLAALLRPGRAADIRRWLQGVSHAALFLGLPARLLLTVYGG